MEADLALTTNRRSRCSLRARERAITHTLEHVRLTCIARTFIPHNLSDRFGNSLAAVGPADNLLLAEPDHNPALLKKEAIAVLILW